MNCENNQQKWHLGLSGNGVSPQNGNFNRDTNAKLSKLEVPYYFETNPFWLGKWHFLTKTDGVRHLRNLCLTSPKKNVKSPNSGVKSDQSRVILSTTVSFGGLGLAGNMPTWSDASFFQAHSIYIMCVCKYIYIYIHVCVQYIYIYMYVCMHVRINKKQMYYVNINV